MAAIHDEFNTWKGEAKRSRADQAQWLTDKGIDAGEHSKFKTAARQSKSRGSKTAEQKSAVNAQRRTARTAGVAESLQPHLDASHHTLSQALQGTDQPVKVEFTTDRSGSGKWADRMVPAHSVPMFAQGSDSQNMVVTVFNKQGAARAFHLTRPKSTAAVSTHGHSTGGRVISKVVDTSTRGTGRPPFSVTMNEGDAQALRGHESTLSRMEANEPASVEVPSEMRQMRSTMEYLEGVHQENLNTIHMTDHQPERTTDQPVVSSKDLGRARRFMARASDTEMERDSDYAQRAGAYLDAEEAKAGHAKAVASQKRTVQNLAGRGRAPDQVIGVDADRLGGLDQTGIMDDQTSGFKVTGANNGSTAAADPRIDSDQMIDYVHQNADTPSMRQARTAMHLARSGSAGSDAEAATHAKKAEAAAGVQWDKPPTSAESNPMSADFAGAEIPTGPGLYGSGVRVSPAQIDLSGNGPSDAEAKNELTARTAGQMRSHPLYAGAVGTGLAKSVKAMGGATSPTSNLGKVADQAKSVAVTANPGITVGYPQGEYRRGITASSRDPLPPYHGVENTDEARPDENEAMGAIRDQVRAGMSTLIGHRNTRASRGR